ncbi:hypothetical protein [Wenzhouxiangella sp. EGI_FJ10409]|uniref:hypothetical protein n=1 Tax=Wenzhouxiangella sp. EGI_FJ10409 TaxID=3243767 RepID=UPI0035D7DFE1
MITIRQQRGAALFVGIFLITVVVVFAAVVALTSASQHISQARAGLAEQAWYAAVARLEDGIQEVLASENCPPTGTQTVFEFRTTLDCSSIEVSEGGETYAVYTLSVSAEQGDLDRAVFVRRSLSSQITDLEISP